MKSSKKREKIRTLLDERVGKKVIMKDDGRYGTKVFYDERGSIGGIIPSMKRMWEKGDEMVILSYVLEENEAFYELGDKDGNSVGTDNESLASSSNFDMVETDEIDKINKRSRVYVWIAFATMIALLPLLLLPAVMTVILYVVLYTLIVSMAVAFIGMLGYILYLSLDELLRKSY